MAATAAPAPAKKRVKKLTPNSRKLLAAVAAGKDVFKGLTEAKDIGGRVYALGRLANRGLVKQVTAGKYVITAKGKAELLAK